MRKRKGGGSGRAESISATRWSGVAGKSDNFDRGIALDYRPKLTATSQLRPDHGGNRICPNPGGRPFHTGPPSEASPLIMGSR